MTDLAATVTWAAMPGGPLVPAGLALPLAGIVVLVLAAHMQALTRREMAPSRRRIRVATGWIMLVTAPLTGYAFGVASPTDPRGFILVWLAVAGLLAIIIFLACLDILNSRRLQRGQVRELARQMRELQDQMRRQTGASAQGSPAPDADYRP